MTFIALQIIPSPISPTVKTLAEDNSTSPTNVISTESVTTIDTTTNLTSNFSSASFGTLVTYTATISNYQATGTVTFMDGTTELGTNQILGGVATLSVNSLSIGNHTITAVYSGDTNYNSSTSNDLVITINKGYGNISLSNSPKTDDNGNELPFIFGDTISFLCRFTPKLATGTVTFKDGPTALATVDLASSKISLTARYSTILSAGTHNITAVYNGDDNFYPSTSDAVAVTIGKTDTTTTLTSSSNPALFGTNVDYTATISNSSATGTVTFMDGDTELGSDQVINGVATMTKNNLPIGDHVIKAIYNGDLNCNSSTSNDLAVTVNKGYAEMSLFNNFKYDDSGNVLPFVFGDTIDFICRLLPKVGTGTVTFKDGATELATVPLTSTRPSLIAFFSAVNLSAGNHSITVDYSGNDNLYPSTSSELMVTINKADTATNLTSSTNTSFIGDAVTYIASINNEVATGTVNFMDGNTLLASSEIKSGVATFTTSGLSVGDHSITAIYSGDSNFNGSTSTASPISVTTKMTDTKTTIASSSNPSSYGDSVTFTATVNEAAATGTITFIDGSTVLSTIPINNGSASYTTNTFTVGTHTISAIYNGDSKFNTSISSNLTQTVNKKDTKIMVTSSLNPAIVGAEITYTITIDSSKATGNITLMDGSTILASNIDITEINGVPTAIYKTSSLTIGSHYISASYSGDTNYNESKSSTLTQMITKNPPIISYININGPSSIIIPSSGDNNINYTADVLDQYNNIISNAEVTWSLSGIPNGVTISSTGDLTVNSTAGSGNILIIAKSKTNSSVVGYQLVSLTKTMIPVQYVLINKTTLSLKAGSNNSLTAIVFPLYAYCESIDWVSSDSSVVTVDKNGNLHAVSSGKATITVTITSNGKIKSAKCNVKVTK